MYPFRYESARDLNQLGSGVAGTEFLGGGTDLMQLMKDNVRRPDRLIDISALPSLDMIEFNGVLKIGALARMSDVGEHAAVKEQYPVISQALLASASPQVRNMARIGGNLLQRTRCVYFRDQAVACNKRVPGSGCFAIGGENRMHAVLGGSDHCVATHASDLAVALVALDAVVVTHRPQGGRRIALESFHLLPGDTPQIENVLEPGELIVAIEVPPSPLARRSLYRKVRDRASFEFALASAAVALTVADGKIRAARIALGGVGTKPWRARDAEAALAGQPAEQSAFEAAAALALAGAKPLEQNGFKIQLAQRNLVRALQSAVG